MNELRKKIGFCDEKILFKMEYLIKFADFKI